MKRKLLFIICSIASIAIYAADNVEFKASAPEQVVIGRPFQLSYTVNQAASNLRAPEFTDFEHIAGPYSSQSSSTTFVNGKRTSSFTQTYTYTLLPKKEGTFTISPATIKVDGTQYTSNGVRITVLPPDKTDNNNSSPTSQNNAITEENIFVRTIVSKTKVHEQEALLLTYKLYFAGVNVSQLTNNTRLPEFKGFLKQELDLGQIQSNIEHYNGRNYQTAVIYRTILFPQRNGELVIEPAQFEALLQVPNQAPVRSIFDDFFNSYVNVTKKLQAPKVTIHVDPLPSKPAGFSGGVGEKFKISSKISSTDVQVNEALTLTIDIQGTGNMKLLKNPDVDWPEGFEVYDPKVENNFKTTTTGINGSKHIEFLAIPRARGTYNIPPIKFAYYDTQADSYKTLTTPGYTINVTRGSESNDVNSTNESNTPVVSKTIIQETIKPIGDDIRYIYTGNLKTKKEMSKPSSLKFGSLTFWLWYLIPFVCTVILFLIFHKKIKENADIARVRYKKASKVAKRRLKKAARLLKENQKEAFFEEIERASWTYLSDRLSIPTSELNKENIAQILISKGIAQELIEELHRVLSTAELARYAPTYDYAMQQIYNDTINIINQLESAKL